MLINYPHEFKLFPFWQSLIPEASTSVARAKTCLNSVQSRWLIVYTLIIIVNWLTSLNLGCARCKNSNRFDSYSLERGLLLMTLFFSHGVLYLYPTDLHGFTQIHASLRSRGQRCRTYRSLAEGGSHIEGKAMHTPRRPWERSNPRRSVFIRAHQWEKIIREQFLRVPERAVTKNLCPIEKTDKGFFRNERLWQNYHSSSFWTANYQLSKFVPTSEMQVYLRFLSECSRTKNEV